MTPSGSTDSRHVAPVTRPIQEGQDNEHWTKWLSKKDRAYIAAVERSVKEGMLPSTTALEAVNTSRIAAEVELKATFFARLLQGVRNAGVLLPVMITWTSFALASTAYSASVAASSGQNQSQSGSPSQLFSFPLLEQWEHGFTVSTAPFLWFQVPLVFDGQRWFTFSHVAIVDAALILGLFGITIVAQLIEAEGLQRARKAMRQLEIKLFSIALSGAGGPDSGQTIEMRTQRAFERIEQSVSNLNNAVGGFVAAMEQVPATTLKVVSDRLLEFERTTSAAQDNVNEQVSRFVEGTGNVVTNVSESVAALTNHWTTVKNQVEQVGTSATAAAQAAAEAGRFVGELSGAVNNLTVVQGGVEAKLQGVSGAYERAIERLETVGSHFDQTAELQRQMLDAQAAAAQQIRTLRQTGQTLSGLLQQIAELERALGVEVIDRSRKKKGLRERIRRWVG